ncbi:putative pfs domain-containing protein [Rosellinia necatrix]|uniref:Putative pfs domain-containing protein n=1 Tax=Rosellinia necatrix TaxID=77044 RepID=A0A1S8AA71_ROSNE|nr:putative pfs domain-containing protein [Rosellinia necatrix]
MDLIETVKSALEEQDSSWLLIFDNVEDSSFNEAVEAMPNKARKASAIVMTSQLEELKHHTQSVIHLTSLGTQEGVDLLLKCLQRDLATVSDRDYELLREISSRLGGLPLALAHTGGYMSKSKEELSEFNDFFNDRWEHIIYNTTQERVHKYKSLALQVVWDFALEKLEANQRKRINILAYLNADNVEKEWLVEERCLSRGWVDNGLSAKSQSSYSVHRSLQIALRLKLDQDENERMVVLGHAISIMRRVTPKANNLQVPNQKYWPAFAKASPHVFSMCLAFKAAHPAILGTEELAKLFYDTGFHYWERWSTVPQY